MRRPSVTAVRAAAVSMLAAASVAACGLSNTGTPSTSNGGPRRTPLKGGGSLSPTAALSPHRPASPPAPPLLAPPLNSHARPPGPPPQPVRLVVMNDNSDKATVQKNYGTLIAQDHVDLVLGPFSSLLTVPAATVANKYGFAMTAGSATAPSVYGASLPNLFSTSAPVATQ